MRGFVIAALAALSLWPVHAAAQSASGKPIVAIYQMDDVARTGQADTFSRMLETAIAGTSKFRVIERERLGKLLGEQARAKSGLVTTNKPGKIGGFEGADFLIYGSITTVSVSKKADVGTSLLSGLLSGSRGSPSCNNAIVTLGIDIKITDADTGEVRYVKRIDETAKSAAACDTEAQVDMSLLFRAAAERIAAGLVTTIYPIQVAAVQGDGTIVLNYGEGAVTSGATLAVFTKGEAIRDPATGEVIGNDEQLLGLISVTDVQPRFSKAVAASAFPVPPAVGSIVRIATAQDIARFRPSKGGKRR